MITRRQFAVSKPWLAASPLAVSGCSPGPATDGYEALGDRTWQLGAMTGLGGAAQKADAAFAKELMAWIRFNGADAARCYERFALQAAALALPRWLRQPVEAVLV